MSYQKKYEDFSWIKVKRHKDDVNATMEERFNALNEHHVKETEFLVAEVRKLAMICDKLIESQHVPQVFGQNW